MGLRIHTNVPTQIALHHLHTTRNQLDQNFSKLSSGLKINHAEDDAAGLAISERLRMQNRSLSQVQRNVSDGISLIQIIEGSLSEISNILIRLREISLQAASDNLNSEERKNSNIEFQQLLAEIDRIANGTEFNRLPVLNEDMHIIEIQVGSGNNPSLDRIPIFDFSKTAPNTVGLQINLSHISDKRNAQSSLDALQRAMSLILNLRANLGALQNRLQSTTKNISTNKENLSSAMSRIRDVDFAEETAELTKNNILLQAGIAVLSQANTSTKNVLDILGQGGSR